MGQSVVKLPPGLESEKEKTKWKNILKNIQLIHTIYLKQRDIKDSSKMEYAVDMQGFKQRGNDFVLKELAILCLSDNSEPLVWLFKEPFAWKRLTDKYRKENQWLENNSHGIPWSSDNVDYTHIDEIIRETLKDATRIIVRNQIIQQWMQQHWSY